MTKRNLILTTLLLLSYCLGYGQSYSGTIQDSKGVAVPYVNIGVVGKRIGTVSDTNGEYTLAIGKQYDNDTIRISSLGYEAISMQVGQFKEGPHDITLQNKDFGIDEIVVTPRETKEVRLGKFHNLDGNVTGSYNNPEMGHERGVRLNIKRSTLLRNITFQVKKNHGEQVLVRVNVYEEDGDNWRQKNHKPIYMQIPKGGPRNIKIELKNTENGAFVVDDDILVAIEWIDKESKQDIDFAAALLGDRLYVRDRSQDVWEKFPIGTIGIIVDGIQER